jgi:hypothetical protein
VYTEPSLKTKMRRPRTPPHAARAPASVAVEANPVFSGGEKNPPSRETVGTAAEADGGDDGNDDDGKNEDASDASDASSSESEAFDDASRVRHVEAPPAKISRGAIARFVRRFVFSAFRSTRDAVKKSSG